MQDELISAGRVEGNPEERAIELIHSSDMHITIGLKFENDGEIEVELISSITDLDLQLEILQRVIDVHSKRN